MTNFAELQFPSQMRPELAKHVAETMCWAPGDSSVVGFTALSLLYASWQSDEPQLLSGLLQNLQPVFEQKVEQVLETLSKEETYVAQAAKHEVGPLTTYHAQQAIRFWMQRLKPTQVSQHRTVVSSIFSAAINEDSDRAESMATTISDAIDAMTPSAKDDSAAAEGLMIMGPHGPLGPFPDMRAAKQYMVKFMRAHMAGLPPPPLPGQEPKAEEADAMVDDEKQPEGPGMFVYSRAEAISVIQKLPPPAPNEGNMQQRRLLEAMANARGWRKLAVVPDANPLAKMYQRFPHFSDALDFIAQSLALAGCGSEGNPVRIPPILLRGVQGTGKSYFAKELAKLLGTYYVEKDLSVMSEAFVIGGLDPSWKGSKPGIVFESLVNGKTANPLICLNEIDKASARGGHNSPISALYSLMEQESATSFMDEFVPVAIDASRIIWVCTANDGEIPAPILDRMEIFDIKEPTREQCRLIATSVWESICVTVLPKGHGFSMDLGETLLDAVSAMRPRVMRKTLKNAAGRAAFKGNKFMTLEDLSQSQLRYEETAKRGIGFMAPA